MIRNAIDKKHEMLLEQKALHMGDTTNGTQQKAAPRDTLYCARHLKTTFIDLLATSLSTYNLDLWEAVISQQKIDKLPK